MNYANSMKLKIAQSFSKKKIEKDFQFLLISGLLGGTRRYLCLNVHSLDKCHTMVFE